MPQMPHLPYGITQYYLSFDTGKPVPGLYMGGGPDLHILLWAINEHTYNGGKSHGKAVDSCKTKVRKLHAAISRDENILRLQVTVHDTVGMNEVHTFQDLTKQILHISRSTQTNGMLKDRQNREMSLKRCVGSCIDDNDDHTDTETENVSWTSCELQDD